MARPSLGSSARNIQAGLKISAAERDDLTVEYGNPGRGLRAILDDWYDTKGASRLVAAAPSLAPSVPSNDITTEYPLPITADAHFEKKHRHKRDRVVRTDWDSGMRIDVWACACGEELR